MPADARVFFLAQKPYLPIATLREALSYPQPPEANIVADYGDVLAACGLAHLLCPLDERDNWSLILSGGEQQRLAIGRALLCRPDWLFLDEATSALDAVAEQRMYALLAQRLPNATFVSITHRRVLPASKPRLLRINAASRRVKSEALAGH